jgi:hypothetical protein
MRFGFVETQILVSLLLYCNDRFLPISSFCYFPILGGSCHFVSFEFPYANDKHKTFLSIILFNCFGINVMVGN